MGQILLENLQLTYLREMYIWLENKNSLLNIKCIKSNVNSEFGPQDNTGGVKVIRNFWCHFNRP
jgi:hypothetical protein